MATYVFSDVHGHVAPLARLLSRISPADEDQIFMLGDMIDRGPDPMGVMYLCRDLPGCTVLRGNHEDLMLNFLAHPTDQLVRSNWVLNGGMTTAEGLGRLSAIRCDDMISWVESLPLWTHTTVGDRRYLLVHAGIRPLGIEGLGECTDEELEMLMALQDPEDLLWIREEFWGNPTGLLNETGAGTIVIAGHTPTPYLMAMADLPERDPHDEKGLARMVRVGASPKTGGVCDRWDIDAGAAGGHGYGQILIVRLDDGEEFYEPVGENE